MRTVFIAGEPATGKTELVRAVMKELGPGSPFKWRTVRATYHPETRVWVLGVYDGKLFSGTDRLSMGCLPDVLEWIKTLPGSDSLLAEGDRLANQPFLRAIQPDCYLLMLKATPEMKAKRHEHRGDSQSESFLKRCATKCGNLKRDFPFVFSQNDTLADLWLNKSYILMRLMSGRTQPPADTLPCSEG